MVPVLAEPFCTTTFCCPCGFPKYLSGTTTPCKELVEPDASHYKKRKKEKKKERSHKQVGLKQGNSHKQEDLKEGNRQGEARNGVAPTYFVGTTTLCKELVEPDASHCKNKKQKKKDRYNLYKQEGLKQGNRQSRWFLCLAGCVMLVSIIMLTSTFSPLYP